MKQLWSSVLAFAAAGFMVLMAGKVMSDVQTCAAVGVAFAVIPYVIARACQEIRK